MENKILELDIQPIFKKVRKFSLPFLKEKTITNQKHLSQNKCYRFGLRIKNQSSSTIDTVKIGNLNIKSVANPIGHDEFIKFHLTLNNIQPGEIKEVWFPKKFITLLTGLCWIKCSIDPLENITFKTFQVDTAGQRFEYGTNNWGAEFFIVSRVERQQFFLNIILAIISIIALLPTLQKWLTNICTQ